MRRVEDGVDGVAGGVGGSSSSRGSTLIGRRLAVGGGGAGDGGQSDFVVQTDREDSPLHSKRSSMCLMIGAEGKYY